MIPKTLSVIEWAKNEYPTDKRKYVLALCAIGGTATAIVTVQAQRVKEKDIPVASEVIMMGSVIISRGLGRQFVSDATEEEVQGTMPNASKQLVKEYNQLVTEHGCAGETARQILLAVSHTGLVVFESLDKYLDERTAQN